jgi:hypothetical protein
VQLLFTEGSRVHLLSTDDHLERIRRPPVPDSVLQKKPELLSHWKAYPPDKCACTVNYLESGFTERLDTEEIS